MSRLLNSDEVEKFRELLLGYKLKPEVTELFSKSNFAVIAGPAGAGKDTLRDNLIKKYPKQYLPILSTTTRPPRIGEKDGFDYHFREVEEVALGLNKKEFFQADLVHNQQISCLHINEIKMLNSDQTGLSILIPYTENELRKIKPNMKTIFLIPPNLKILKQRLQSECLLDRNEVDRRLQAAAKEMQEALSSESYYCLISDDIDVVTQKANDYLQRLVHNKNEDKNARQIIAKILNNLSNTVQ